MRLPSRTLAFAAILPLLATSASAATATEPEVVAHQVNDVAVSSGANYWTAERMAGAATKAAPEFVPTDDALGDIAVEEHVFVDSVSPTADMNLTLLPGHDHNDKPEKDPQYAPTSGVLFFIHDDTDYACSASVLASDEGNAVVTAGHCLYSDQAWSENMIFAPGYDDATAPYGLWEVTTMVAPRPFVKRGITQYDIGMVRVADLHNKKLQNVVGANGYATGRQGHEHDALVLGFDVDNDDDGYLQQCIGDAEHSHRQNNGGHPFWHDTEAAVECDVTETAHGGPWLLKEDRTGTVGVAFAITGDSDGDLVYGRPFDRTLINLLNETGE